jgi:site-specific DNA recombinase
MDKPANMKYFLYARKSSESEDRQVASINSQIDELKALAKRQNISIVKLYREEKSAKSPGRPIFNAMLDRIQNGEAQGIICWKLDRLARNPVDGGRISWMLQKSVLHHIQTYERDYQPSDNVLLMNVEFGIANQFILDLSSNTKRGLRSRAKEGWFPGLAPIGYLNNRHKDPSKTPIYVDIERFSLMKKLWSALLEKRCSIREITQLAFDT